MLPRRDDARRRGRREAHVRHLVQGGGRRGARRRAHLRRDAAARRAAAARQLTDEFFDSEK